MPPRTCGCCHINLLTMETRYVPKKWRDIVVKKPTPPRHEKYCYTDDDDAHGVLLNHPIVMDDDVSNSGGNKIHIKDGSLNKETPISKRVHTNAQQRVVPFVGNIVEPLPRVTLTVAHDGTGFYVALHVPRYKDPPRYVGVTDFGQTMEPVFVPPLLEPKNSE